MQTVWTVGAFDQSLARVERPDKLNPDGSMQYGRTSIDFEWIVITPSVEIAKTARLFGKIIEKTKFEEYKDNTSFQHWFDSVPIDDRGTVTRDPETNMSVQDLLHRTGEAVTMSPDFVMEHETFESLQYRTALYRMYSKWLDEEYAKVKEKLRRLVAMNVVRKDMAKRAGVKLDDISDKQVQEALDEEEYALPVITDNQLRLGAMYKAYHDMLIGSQDSEIGNGYTPFLPGVMPSDPYNLDLEAASEFINDPIASDKEENENEENVKKKVKDEETESAIEIVRIQTGMIVVTEFGIGICTRKTFKSPLIYVNIPGPGGPREVSVPLTSVFIPKTQLNRVRLKRIYDALRRKGLPTTTLTHEGGNIIVHDMYIPEKELLSAHTVKPNAPLLKVAPKELPPDMERLPTDTKIAPPTAVGEGLAPRSNRTAGKTPAKVVKPVIQPGKPAGRPAGGGGGRGFRIKTPPRNVLPPSNTPTRPATSAQPPKIRTPVNKLPNVEVHVAHISKQLCLAMETEDNEPLELLTEHGFHRIGRSVTAQIKSWRGLKALIDELHKRFTIDPKCDDALEAALVIFQRNEANLERLIYNLSVSREFLRNNARISKDPKVIFPYLMVIDDSVWIVINAVVSKEARKLYKHTLVRQVGMFDIMEPFYLRFCRNFKDLHDTMEAMDDDISIKNLPTFYKEYEEAKKGK
jgi:hypothetical protein